MGDELQLKDVRKTCIRLANKAGDGNLQSIFSAVEIIWTLYNRIIDISQIMMKSANRDFFLCSKGQATLGLMVVLAQKGIIPYDELETYGEFDSRISMQADKTKFDYGIEMSAGSLGHGLPLATGVSLSKKIQGDKGRVFVLVGDGELHEGTNWEAISVIGSRNLCNITVIVDDNGSHSDMYGKMGLSMRFESVGFEVLECEGHNVNDLEERYNYCIKSNKPTVIIAKTRRGYGSKTLMTGKSWFHRAPSDCELELLLTEITEFDPHMAEEYVLVED